MENVLTYPIVLLFTLYVFLSIFFINLFIHLAVSKSFCVCFHRQNQVLAFSCFPLDMKKFVDGRNPAMSLARLPAEGRFILETEA